MLICVGGRGYYQEWGKEAVEMTPGSVVNIPAEVKHWHGAAPDSWFSHLAVEVPGEESSNEWCEPDMHDIGILASFDPVAVDQACIDLVYGAEDGQSLVNRIESRNGLHTLEHAQDIGLGSREYQLVSIDE